MAPRERAVSLVSLLSLLATAALAAPDPAVYITASDTRSFSPVTALDPTGFPGRWYQRQVAFAARGEMILNAYPGGLYPDLTCDPGLRGRYNLYVNLREVDSLTGLQLQLSGQELAYTVTPALGTAEVHTNRDILVARDLPLDGRTIRLRTIGRLVYFSYLKFVPAALDDPTARVDPQRVREEPLQDVREGWRRTREEVPEGLHELRHVSTPPAAPAAIPGGYVVFGRSALDLVFPDARPAQQEVLSELRANAAPGEYEPVTFCVYSPRALGLCRLTVSDLTDGTHRIPRSNVALAAVAARNLRTTYDGKVYMRVPAVLESTSPTPVEADRTRQFWLTVHVPEGAPPGSYTGTVTFAPAVGAPTALPLRVRVWRLQLREPRDVACGMYDRLWAVEAGKDWLRAHFAEMRSHGLSTVAYCGGLAAPIVLRGGRAEVEFSGRGGLERVLDAYREAGFPCPMVWMMDDALWTWCAQQAPVGSEPFRALYRQALQSILSELPGRRWQGLIFQPVDEPGSYGQRSIPGYVDRWALESQLIKEAGGTVEADHIPLSTEDPLLKEPLQRALPFLDIITERFSNKPVWFERDGWWWGNIKERVAALGKQLWSYNINDAAFFPELPTMRSAYGLFLWREGIKGQLLWEYRGPVGNPFNSLDGNCTDWMYSYPAVPEAGEPGGPSLMWECLREGRDDYKYLYTLECLIAEARAAGREAKAAAATALLERLRASFDDARLRERNLYLECRWEETVTAPGGAPTVKGGFNIPNGWGLADYDEWRTAVAREIVQLTEGR